MLFKDGLRKAGYFENNIYQKPLVSAADYEAYKSTYKGSFSKLPAAFMVEIQEYIEHVAALKVAEDNSKFIGQEFVEQEKEDIVMPNELENMKEMASAPFGPETAMTKS